MDYPGWAVTAQHPIEEGTEGFCATCFGAIGPAVAFATDFGSTAFQSTVLDESGSPHTVRVEAV